jgi:membrane protein involved in colicin uptake
MNLQKYFELVAKMLKGEELTEEEKTALKAFDTAKAIDSAQAEARRKAEKDAAEANAKAEDALKKVKEYEEKNNAAKSDTEKLADQIKSLTERLNQSDAKSKKLEEEAARAARKEKVREIAAKYGVKFVEGIDHKLLFHGFEAALSALKTEELDNEATVKPLVDVFRQTNAAAIVAPDTPGTGDPSKRGATGTGKNPWTKEHFNLTEQLQIIKTNPALAASLKQAAGVKD